MSFPSRQQARTWSRGLGWFSIGLGLAELLAARPLARAVGLAGQPGLVRAYGLREVATGVGLLRARDPGPWMWARVAGDALDLATLGAGLQGRHARGAAVGMAAVAGITALDLIVARTLARAPVEAVGDYARRSGFPLPVAEMRGAAVVDFEPPNDLTTLRLLRPWRNGVAPVDAAAAQATAP